MDGYRITWLDNWTKQWAVTKAAPLSDWQLTGPYCNLIQIYFKDVTDSFQKKCKKSKISLTFIDNYKRKRISFYAFDEVLACKAQVEPC